MTIRLCGRNEGVAKFEIHHATSYKLFPDSRSHSQSFVDKWGMESEEEPAEDDSGNGADPDEY